MKVSLQWILAATASLVIIAILLVNLDSTALSINWAPGWLFVALLCFATEACLSGIRLWLGALRQSSFRSGFAVNGWYTGMVLALPARLGELATMGIYCRMTSLTLGAATLSIVFQRMVDVIFLVLFGALLALLLDPDNAYLITLSAVWILMAVLIVWHTRSSLGLAARLLIVIHPDDPGLTRRLSRRLLRIILQGRLWSSRAQRAGVYPWIIIATACKWIAIYGGISALVLATQLTSTTQALIASTSFNLSGLVPLHGLGGIGFSDAAVTGSLASSGLSLADASAIAIVIRFAIIAVGGFTFAVTWILLKESRSWAARSNDG